MSKAKIPVDEKTMEEITKQLAAAKIKTDAFFKRYGFDPGIGDHPAKRAFTRVVEMEHANGQNVDFPMARKMFMLGYLMGHDSFPMKRNCDTFGEKADG